MPHIPYICESELLILPSIFSSKLIEWVREKKRNNFPLDLLNYFVVVVVLICRNVVINRMHWFHLWVHSYIENDKLFMVKWLNIEYTH